MTTPHTTNAIKEKQRQYAARAKIMRIAKSENPAMDYPGEPDHIIAAAEAVRAVESLHMTIEIVGGYLSQDDEGWQHHSYIVNFTLNGKTVGFHWKTGTAILIPPFAGEVLAYVCRDYSSAVGRSFDDWASEFGYDVDSRKAEKIHRECLELGDKLRQLGLSGAQIETLAEFSNRF